MGLLLKWSVIAPLVEQLAYCKARNVSRTAHRFMMLSSSHRSTGQGSTAACPLQRLPLRALTILLVIAIFSSVPVAAAGENENQTARPQRPRYSGCNVANMPGSCQTIHRPHYLRRLEGGILELQPNQCRSMLDFLRCSLYKMACRRQISPFSEVPCQVSCEHAVKYCEGYVRDRAPWDYLRFTDCEFLPAGGCLDWTISNRRRPPGVAVDNNKFCLEPPTNCSSMFPKRFRRRDWRSGNFSIVVDILVKSVIWYFRGGRPYTFFVVDVKRVHRSNIGLEKGHDKVLSWPFLCYCTNQILVGHRYFLLSHSLRNHHEIGLSVDSVFLPKMKRYRRRFQCWTSRRPCSRKKNRNGPRRRRRRRSIGKRRRFRYS